MTNLLTVLPDFDVAPFTHLLPSLERALISTADLLTLDAPAIAKRAQLPPGEVQKLAEALLAGLHGSCHGARGSEDDEGDVVWRALESGERVVERWCTISTLDDGLDGALGGGIARGHLTEIVGESAAGKTQFLLTLLLSAQLSTGTDPAEKQSALYISTEAPLQTTRLAQILKAHPKLSDLPATRKPSLNRVHSTHIHDVEAQEHILRFQVPVAISKHNVGLLVIDSIAANYRAEFDRGGKSSRSTEALAKRSTQLAQIGHLLRDLAQTHNIAVVFANQVADRFMSIEPAAPQLSTQSSTQGLPISPLPSFQQTSAAAAAAAPNTGTPPNALMLSTNDPLALDHQQLFFTGWGDDPTITNLKTPSLGLTWTHQLGCRVALLREPVYDEARNYAPGEERDLIGWRRGCKVVFSAWCAASKTEFEIWEGGIRSIPHGGVSDRQT